MRIIGSGYDGDLNLTSVLVEEDGREYWFKKPRWISVEERMPEEREDVAAIIRYNENVWEYGIAFRMDGSWHMNGTGKVVVTHWMPLPEPPEMKEE